MSETGDDTEKKKLINYMRKFKEIEQKRKRLHVEYSKVCEEVFQLIKSFREEVNSRETLVLTKKQMEVEPINDILFGLTSIPLETHLKCNIPDPDACVDAVRIGMSTDFFKNLFCRAIEYMKNNQQLIKTLDTVKFRIMEKKMKDMETKMEKEKMQASELVQPDEMTGHYSEFYSLFMDLKIGINLAELTE